MAGATLALDAGEEARGRAIVQTLAAVAEAMVRHAAAGGSVPAPRTKFDAFRAPGISVRDYLARIHKYAACSPECFVLALVYVDRLHQLQGVALSALNVHRVLLTGVVLAAKFFDDHYFNNAYYAKVGGVPGAEMNELELEFLLLVNFSLHVPTDTFARYYNELAGHHAYRSARAAAAPDAAARFHSRHLVVADPDQGGALVYVVRQTPRRVAAPLPAAPTAATRVGGWCAPEDADAQARDAKPPPSRAAGQKRRSAVALGVNA